MCKFLVSGVTIPVTKALFVIMIPTKGMESIGKNFWMNAVANIVINPSTVRS
jgi:hypothetical protein